MPAGPLTAVLYVVGRGWHTDLALPVGELRGPLARAIAPRFPGVRYLVFGFGERAYLLSRDRGLGEMLLALFPHPGAILVTALAAPPAAAFGAEHVIALRLSPGGLDRVADFVWRYLSKDQRGAPEVIAWGPYPGSLFYGSTGTYALGYTCNTWTAEALWIGGLPVDFAGILFAGQVMREARALAAAEARPAATGLRSGP